jgi:NAD(P)-dependent dehydrogenase (short-subunit alcohol dehydrogenase family)
MTGAGRGLGRAAAEQLLRGHPELHLLIPVRGSAAGRLGKELAAATGNPNVSTVRCDLASLGDIRATAAEVGRFLDQGAIPPLSGFIGNAGTQWGAHDAAALYAAFTGRPRVVVIGAGFLGMEVAASARSLGLAAFPTPTPVGTACPPSRKASANSADRLPRKPETSASASSRESACSSRHRPA